MREPMFITIKALYKIQSSRHFENTWRILYTYGDIILRTAKYKVYP